MTHHERAAPHNARAWFIWSLSALAFGYAFFQRVAPSVMVSDLMAEFAISGAVLGYLSALYFYPYVLLQVPLGTLLDRLGARKLLTIAISIAAAGSFLFGSAESIYQAYAGRTLIGIGSAVGFLGSLALAAKWFPPRRYALLTGLVMLVGMTSGIVAQAPLAALIEAIGWRNAMYAGAAFAGLLAVLIFAFVRNAPPENEPDKIVPVSTWGNVWHGFTRAIKRRDVWLVALVAMAMTGPMLSFGGLWGVPYLMVAYDLPRADAAFFTSLLLMGWAFGAPLGGWLSDHIGRRKSPLLIAALIEAALMAVVVLIPGIPLWLTAIVLFLIGMSGGAMAITFAFAREMTVPAIQGTVSGIVNAMTVASGAILQPVIGVLLDWQWTGALQNGARVYAAGEYQTAFICLIVWVLMAVAALLRLPETFCTPMADRVQPAAST
jgi:MFS family permease